ncbi:MAG: hypothetical protein II427_03165 [Firmicutes bacterium]|nr:hypothetical protein [Bacillota bacterium]
MEDYKFTRDTYMDAYNTDIARRATAGGVLRQFNETATRNMAHFGPSYDELLDSGRALMVSRMDIEILQPPMMEEPIQASTWPVLPKGAVIHRCYEIAKDGAVLARGSSDWALVESETRKILRMTADTFPNYRYGVYVPLFEKKLHIDKETADSMETAGIHRVTLRDCDCNGHINNTYYLDILCDLIPELYDYEHHWVRSARIHFAKEAPLGSEITIRRCKEDNIYLFQTFLEDGSLNVECRIELA